MFKKFLPWYLVALVVLSLGFIYGCGAAPTSGGGGAASAVTYYGTQSPGDFWKWNIFSDGTFFGTDETNGFWVSGTYVTLPSGFGKAHVIDSYNNSANDSYAYFLEIPNTMLLVKPGGGDAENKVIICAAAAASAPPAGQYNWVTLPWKDWDYTQDNAYGTVEVSETAGSYTFGVKFYKLDNTPPAQASTTESGYSFINGMFTKTGSDLKLFVTPSGVFGADQGSHGGLVGAIKPDPDMITSDVIGKKFRGVLFKLWPSGTGETEPIGATGESAGLIRGASFTDVDVSAEPNYTQSVTLEFGTITNGIASGTLIGNGESSVFTLVCSKVGDSNKILVFGISTQEGSGIPYNFLVIEK
jgi:hypothetical protein